MTDARSQPEPSMEEILASIRRIISEDGQEARAAATERQPAPAEPAASDVLQLSRPVDDDRVLELTDVVEDHSRPLPPAPAPAAVPAPVAKPADPAPRRREMERTTMPPSNNERFVSDRAEEATTSSFARLAQANAARPGPAVRPMPIADGSPTVEQIVRELLRPMLREWLDENLPAIVERVVEEEVARMSRAGR